MICHGGAHQMTSLLRSSGAKQPTRNLFESSIASLDPSFQARLTWHLPMHSMPNTTHNSPLHRIHLCGPCASTLPLYDLKHPHSPTATTPSSTHAQNPPHPPAALSARSPPSP